MRGNTITGFRWPADKSRRYRAGQVVVMAAVALVLVCTMAVFSVDVGYIFCTKARLQNAADAATLGAMQVLVEKRNLGMAESLARGAASQEAAALVAANWQAAGCQIAFGTYSESEFTAAGEGTPASAALVTTSRNADAPGGVLQLFFGPTLNIASVNVNAGATCAVFPGVRTIRANLLPFAIDETALVAPGQTMMLYEKTKTTPGNFGLVDLDGGSQGTSELEEWILYGYDAEVEIDPEQGYVIFEGTPGWRSAIKDEVEERLGDTVFVCVYDQVTEQGSNTEYRVVKFLAAQLTALNMKGGSFENIQIQIQRLTAVADCEASESIDDNLCKIQLVQ